MVQIIAGDKGKGKTKYLLEKANSVISEAEGSVVYLDKNSKHMYELSNKVRLIDISQFPVYGSDGFLGFVSGIISQDRDLEYMFLDSFLKLACLENGEDIGPVIDSLTKMGETHNITFVLSISLDKENLPESAKKDVIIAL